MTKPTRYSQFIESHPIHQAKGTEATVTEIDISPTMYTGNFRTRSSHTPVGNENKAKGTISAAVSWPICVGEACKSTAADSGKASSVTWPPKEEMRMEVHRRRYVESRSRSVGPSVKRGGNRSGRKMRNVETLTPRAKAAGC